MGELDPSALSLAAASGNATLEVFQKPRVAILATGDELVLPGETPGPDQIVASNSVGIAELVRRAGGTPDDLGIIRDDPAATERAIADTLQSGADILVTIGGASVGDRDFVHGALQKCGVDLDFWKIAMRPGKPLMYGRIEVKGKTVHVIGLPGNPVSSLVCSLVFSVLWSRGSRALTLKPTFGPRNSAQPFPQTTIVAIISARPSNQRLTVR